MSSTTVPNPANGSFPSRSCRLSAGWGAQHTDKQRSRALFTGKGSHAQCHSSGPKSIPNIILKEAVAKCTHTILHKRRGSLGKLWFDVKDILHFLTVDKKLWLKCNNLFLSSLAMLNQGSCQKYPLDMIAVTYLKTLHQIFKCTSVWQFCSSSVFLQRPLSVTFHNLLARTFQIESSTNMCF